MVEQHHDLNEEDSTQIRWYKCASMLEELVVEQLHTTAERHFLSVVVVALVVVVVHSVVVFLVVRVRKNKEKKVFHTVAMIVGV